VYRLDVTRRLDRSEPGSLRRSASARLGICAMVGLITAGAVAPFAPWPITVLAGWDTALATYLAWVWISVGRLPPETTQRLATSEDLSHVAAEIVLIAASVVNLSIVGAALIEARNRNLVEAGLINGTAVLSVALAWAVIHTVYALRYARVFYERGGGIDFRGEPPDYRDFAYLAFTIGTTYQVSDTPLLTKEFRRIALPHVLLSYLFATVILATVINVVAGLFRG
jgi:uncharacterized membrane protein